MRLLNKNTARRAAAAAALLTMTAAMSVGAFAADAEDATVAGYLPPQSSEVMVQGDIALHSDVPVGEVDPNYGGYASPVENPIQGNVMMISDETPLPSDTPVEKSEARYTVKGLLGKQVLYTARQEGRVLTLDAPDDNATFRTTILDMQTLMNQGVSTLVLKTDKTSTTLNLQIMCLIDQKDKVIFFINREKSFQRGRRIKSIIIIANDKITPCCSIKCHLKRADYMFFRIFKNGLSCHDRFMCQ